MIGHDEARGADRDELARLVAGDARAFETLYARLQARVLSISRRLIGSAHAAEDVAQETWQAVHRGLASFHGRCRIDTWVLQIAIHRARTAWRGARRSRCETTAASGREPSGSQDRPSTDASPEEDAERREIFALVTAALDNLPDLQRRVVTLCDLEGIDAPTASAALRITPVNCRSLLHRGRKSLRAAIIASVT